jgi:hypothetical protein
LTGSTLRILIVTPAHLLSAGAALAKVLSGTTSSIQGRQARVAPLPPQWRRRLHSGCAPAVIWLYRRVRMGEQVAPVPP